MERQGLNMALRHRVGLFVPPPPPERPQGLKAKRVKARKDQRAARRKNRSGK